MPRYAYRCDACNVEFFVFHSYKEKLEKCEKCQTVGGLVKLLTTPQYKIKKPKQRKVGDLTEEFIQQAQEDLRQQKKDLAKE